MCWREKRQKKFEGCEVWFWASSGYSSQRLIGEVSQDSDSEISRVDKHDAQKESVCEKDNVPDVDKKLEDEGVNIMNNTTVVGPSA